MIHFSNLVLLSAIIGTCMCAPLNQRQGQHSTNNGAFGNTASGAQSQGGSGGGQGQGLSSFNNGPGGASGTSGEQSQTGGFGNTDLFGGNPFFSSNNNNNNNNNPGQRSGGSFFPSSFPAFKPIETTVNTDTQLQGQGTGNGADLLTITLGSGTANTDSKSTSQNTDKATKSNSQSAADLSGNDIKSNIVNQINGQYQGQESTKNQITGKSGHGVAGAQTANRVQAQGTIKGNSVSDVQVLNGRSRQNSISNGVADVNGATQTSGTGSSVSGTGISIRSGSSASTTYQAARQGQSQSKFQGYVQAN